MLYSKSVTSVQWPSIRSREHLTPPAYWELSTSNDTAPFVLHRSQVAASSGAEIMLKDGHLLILARIYVHLQMPYVFFHPAPFAWTLQTGGRHTSSKSFLIIHSDFQRFTSVSFPFSLIFLTSHGTASNDLEVNLSYTGKKGTGCTKLSIQNDEHLQCTQDHEAKRLKWRRWWERYS